MHAFWHPVGELDPHGGVFQVAAVLVEEAGDTGSEAVSQEFWNWKYILKSFQPHHCLKSRDRNCFVCSMSKKIYILF